MKILPHQKFRNITTGNQKYLFVKKDLFVLFIIKWSTFNSLKFPSKEKFGNEKINILRL